MSSNETSPVATRSNPNIHTGKRRSGWRHLLTPSYKSRSDEFLKLFCDTIPSTERLIADYSCALHREILIHGRVYISVNYIAFYSNLFRWVTKLVVKLRDVSEIYKANTAKFIPNAIQIVTTNGDKHVFASFIARDKSYVMILRIWQNNLMFERMSDTEMRNLVHFSYGRDLGMTDDEDFTVNSPEPPSPGILALDLIPQSEESKKDFDVRNISSMINNHTVTPTSRKEDTCSENNAVIYHSESSLFEKGHHRSNSEGRNDYKRNDGIMDQVAEKLTSLTERIKLEHSTPSSKQPSSNSHEEQRATQQTDLKSVDDEVSLGCRHDEEAEPIELTTHCDCENHDGLEIVDYEFDINVDTLFTLIFTNSRFMLTYMARRGLFNVILGSWTRNSGSLKGSTNHQVKQSRQLTYSMNLNHVLAKHVDVKENQTIAELRDGVYVLHSQTTNSGIPYGDTFTVDTTYCLTRKGDINKSRMRVHTLINFKKEKSGWKLSIAKTMIERQSLQGVTDFIENLKNSTDHYISNPSDFYQDTTDDNIPKEHSLRNRFKKKTFNQARTNEESDISVSSEKSETHDTDDFSFEESINGSCMSTMKRRKRSDSTTINYMTMSNSYSDLNFNHKADSLKSFVPASAKNRTFIILLILMILILLTNMIILDRLLKLESKCK